MVQKQIQLGNEEERRKIFKEALMKCTDVCGVMRLSDKGTRSENQWWNRVVESVIIRRTKLYPL